MLSAIRSFFKGYANFSGRSTRPEFWWVWLLNMVIFLPAYYSLFTGVESDKAIRNIAVFSMCIILFIVEFVPLLALIVRRLRDVGIHWAYIFIVFVPLGAVTLLVMLAMPSQRFVEKVIENSEKDKDKENTEDSRFEEMVRKY
ncbi:membrane protein [Streptococcus sp. VT 162]|nr:membrane protein [Streptococcus sp. VT 162]